MNDPSSVRERVVSLFAELAAIPSPSRHERSVADRVIAHLEDLGLTVIEDDTADAIGGDTGNLMCRVPGEGETAAIMLAAHLDTVVPVDDVEPVLQDGVFSNARDAILGADNKAAVAALLIATETFLSAGEPFPTFDLVFTVAEELGVLGSRHLSREALKAPLGAVFDSEGPVGGVVVRAPSQQSIAATFHGTAAHAGFAPENGRSAIAGAARAIASMSLGRLDDETTANVGLINGGTATNIVPDLCVVQAECRSHDEAKLARTAASIVDSLQRGAAEAGVDVDIEMVHEYRRFSLGPRAPVVRLAKAALADLGLEPRLLTSGGASDANVFNSHGLPTVNLDCGMSQVHTPDEHIMVADLERLVGLVGRLVQRAPEYARATA